MTPIEEGIIESCGKSGLYCLDDVVTYLPNVSCGAVFGAVALMSRDGRLLVDQSCYSTYQIALRHQVPYPVPRPIAERESADQSLEC